MLVEPVTLLPALAPKETGGKTDAPELTKALHEQLGLELVPVMRPVDLLLVTVAGGPASPNLWKQ